MKFSIVVPVFNRPTYTQVCLTSLLNNTPSDLAEIIVVDNGSLGPTKRILESFGGKIRIVCSEENLGAAAACNRGLACAKGDCLVFMHNDCVVPKGWTEALPLCLDMLRSSNIKILTPMTNYADENTFILSSDLKDRFLSLKPSNKSPVGVDQINAIIDGTYRGDFDGFAKSVLPQNPACNETSSFCMIVEKSIFAEVGEFDEAFKFRGFEEKEFLLRLQVKGYGCGKAPFFIHHFGNITSDGPGFNCHELKAANEPIYNALLKTYAGIDVRRWSCIVYPDARPEFTPRLLQSLEALNLKPDQVIEVPRPGIFPEREALKWALPQVGNDYVALMDSDFVFDKNMPDIMMPRFSDPRVGCVGAHMRCCINGSAGYFRIWRTNVIKSITFSDKKIRGITPDTDYAEACEKLGYTFLRLGDVVGEHAIEKDPWNIFKIYFRVGVKQRARGRIGTPTQLWGLDGAMTTNTPWSHLALFAYHCGIQVDSNEDPHTKEWENFAYQYYVKVKPFCEALVAEASDPCEPVVAPSGKIKVILASSTFLMGGCERTMLNMALHLDKSKFQPIIGYEEGVDESFRTAALNAGVPVYELGTEDSPKAWSQLLNTQRPDIIVTFLKSGVFEPARRAGIPLIERTPGWGGHSGVTKDNFERVVCEYDKFKHELLAKPEFKPVPDKTEVLYSGIALQNFVKIPTAEARARISIKKDAFVIVSVARLHPKKNFGLQIKALAEILKRGIDAELHIVGRSTQLIEMEEKRRLESLVQQLDLGSKVHFHGLTEWPADFLNAADVVALSSNEEGAPNILIEAMALQKPIVSTDVGGIREITEGLAKYADNPISFADAVIASKDVKTVSYPSFYERFSIERCTERWTSIFEEVYLKSHDRLPYSARKKVNVALLCENLEIGGMEAFVRIFDNLAEKSKFNIFVYSHEGGPLERVLKCKVRLCPGPWEIADKKIFKWLCEDSIDVAIVVTYSRAAQVFASGRPCKVIERLDGVHVELVSQKDITDVVVFQSEMLAEQQVEKYPSIQHETISNGRELDRFRRNDEVRSSFRARHGMADDSVLIASIGRIDQYKNFSSMLGLAEDLLRGRFDKFKIILMGPDHGSRSSISDQIRTMRLDKWVSMLDGDVDGPPRLLSAADVFVHPSRREGLAGVLIEAAAAGLPIVATEVGAARDVVGAENGILVSMDNRMELAQAVLKIARDAGLRASMRQASLLRSGRFCARQMVRKYEDLILDQTAIKRREDQEMPLLTIVMPVHDRVEYLDQAIESVLKQTSKDWRMIIAIDGMEPPQGILDIIEQRPDPRISSVRSRRVNQCVALNHAVRQARTPFSLRLDSDDILAPNAVETILRTISENQGCGYFYSSYTTVDESLKPISVNGHPPTRISEEFSPLRLEEWNIANPCVVWRNSEFLAAGGFAEDIPYGEDYLLPLTMALHGTKFKCIPSPLYLYRIHKAGNICASVQRNEQDCFQQTIRKRYLKLKTLMNISWSGEDPRVMRPRIQSRS